MSELERELKAALDAKSASVTPDPQSWEKHRSAALTQPLARSPRRFGQRRLLPLVVAAAVVLVTAVGTSIIVTSNGTSPASAPIPAVTTSPVVGPSLAATSVAPSLTPGVALNVPPPACIGAVSGSAQLTPVGVTGFTVRMQVHQAAGGDVLCAGVTGAAGGTVQTSTGGSVAGNGLLDLAASSTWDQGSPVFVWGAVDNRVSDLRVTGTNGNVVQVQFAALLPARRAFVAVLPANTKAVTIAATAAAGGAVSTRNLPTIFGAPDALTTAKTPSPPPTSASVTTTGASTTNGPPTTPATPTSTTPTSAGLTATCDGAGMGIGIADLGVGSALVSFNYLQAAKTLCFSNGGPLTVAPRVPGVMPYAARTTLVSGQGIWGAVTPKVAKVIITDGSSPNGRPAQFLTLGSDLKAFIEETTGTVHLQAFSATGTVLYTLTLR